MNRKYQYKLRPKGFDDRYPPLIVFDSDNKAFRPLTEFYNYELGRLSDNSSISYLQALLPYFSWLDHSSNYQGALVKWTHHPDAIRDSIRSYLIENLYCKVQDHYLGTFSFVKLTRKSPSTVRHFLSALRSFYNSMIIKKLYTFENPLIDSSFRIFNELNSILDQELSKRSRMPDIAGTEEPRNYRRTTDSYFKIIGEKWEPEIIDDISLPSQILNGGKKINWKLRDEVIARLLFETGARASEVIEVTIGDYRKRNSIREMNTFSKGSFGKRVKFLYFSDDTAILLNRYISSERKLNDKNNLSFDELSDDAPLFLTARGTPYTYHSWYPNWIKVCKIAGINLNPHKTRHWYVTQTLRTIYETSKNEADIERHTRELISYMKWKSKDTIEVYEHFFDVKRHLEIHDQFLKNMDKETKGYQSNKKSKISTTINENKNSDNLIQKTVEDTPLERFLSGLE